MHPTTPAAAPATAAERRLRDAARCWGTFAAVLVSAGVVAAATSLAARASSPLVSSSSPAAAARRLDHGGNHSDPPPAADTTCHANPAADAFNLQGAGTSVLYLMGIALMFVCIHVVCERHFVPIIQAFVDRTSLSPDVVGATLMAAGSSAPELFAAVMGVIFHETREVGVGTVVGSTVFNVLVIIGVSVLVSPGQQILVSGRSVARDSAFYLLALLLLVGCIADGTLSFIDALFMVLVYFCYVTALLNWQWIRARVPGCLAVCGCKIAAFADAEANDGKVEFADLEKEQQQQQEEEGGETAAGMGGSGDSDMEGGEGYAAGGGDVGESSAEGGQRTKDAAEARTATVATADTSGAAVPSCCILVSRLLLKPLEILFAYTVPDVKDGTSAARRVLAFLMCLLWLFVLVFLMIEWAEKAGCLLSISKTVMGLTVTAIGTSTPDAIASFLTASKGRQGGKMAISNVFGSNIFDILLALCLPVVLFSQGKGIPIDLAENVTSVVVLFAVFVFLLAALAFGRPQLVLGKWVAWVHVIGYLVYLIVIIAEDASRAHDE